MPRIRSLKPEAFQSELLARVSLAAERTFHGLSTQADDRGRFPDKPATINGLLWAERSETVLHSTADLEAELAELAAVGAICRYTGCDGRSYLHSLTWDEDQKIDKPSKSRLPRCPVHGLAEDCGLHGGSCSPREPSRNPRESSRALDSGQTGQASGNCGKPSRESSRKLANPREPSTNSSDQQERKSSRALASPRELSMVDLGPRTFKTPPTPPSVQPPILVGLPDARAEEGEGDLHHERTPEAIEALIAEVRAIRPDWTTRSVRRVLNTEAVTERPWLRVRPAFLAVAADPETEHPGRLACDGPWWRSAATAPAETVRAAPEWCRVCGPNRRLEDPAGNDLGPCPVCHPGTQGRSA